MNQASANVQDAINTVASKADDAAERAEAAAADVKVENVEA